MIAGSHSSAVSRGTFYTSFSVPSFQCHGETVVFLDLLLQPDTRALLLRPQIISLELDLSPIPETGALQ